MFPVFNLLLGNEIMLKPFKISTRDLRGNRCVCWKVFFGEAPVCFFCKYGEMFDKHTAIVMKSVENLAYSVGDNSCLRGMLL